MYSFSVRREGKKTERGERGIGFICVCVCVKMRSYRNSVCTLCGQELNCINIHAVK